MFCLNQHDTNFQILQILEIFWILKEKVYQWVWNILLVSLDPFFPGSTVPPFHGSLTVLWDGWTSCFWLADEALVAAAWGRRGFGWFSWLVGCESRRSWTFFVRRDGKNMQKQRSIDLEGDHFFIEHHHRWLDDLPWKLEVGLWLANFFGAFWSPWWEKQSPPQVSLTPRERMGDCNFRQLAYACCNFVHHFTSLLCKITIWDMRINTKHGSFLLSLELLRVVSGRKASKDCVYELARIANMCFSTTWLVHIIIL